jgi:hypothetical protein
MGSYTAEDHKKLVHALCARDIRRLTAAIQGLDLDPVTFNEIACNLEQIETRLFTLAFVNCHVQDGEDEVSLVDQRGHYSDGRATTTKIFSDDGFVTVVHHPDPEHAETSPGPEELDAECCPEGMREGDTHQFESGPDLWEHEDESDNDS